jgi:hypothetical protein
MPDIVRDERSGPRRSTSCSDGCPGGSIELRAVVGGGGRGQHRPARQQRGRREPEPRKTKQDAQPTMSAHSRTSQASGRLQWGLPSLPSFPPPEIPSTLIAPRVLPSIFSPDAGLTPILLYSHRCSKRRRVRMRRSSSSNFITRAWALAGSVDRETLQPAYPASPFRICEEGAPV